MTHKSQWPIDARRLPEGPAGICCQSVVMRVVGEMSSQWLTCPLSIDGRRLPTLIADPRNINGMTATMWPSSVAFVMWT